MKKDEFGFTLIELIVVIAIIGVIVTIAIVAIDPTARINASYDRTAQSNVRSTGTLISTCVTNELSFTPPQPYEPCGTAGVPLTNYGVVPAGVVIDQGFASGDNDVCVSAQGSLDHWYVFRYSVGIIVENSGILPVLAEDRCP